MNNEANTKTVEVAYNIPGKGWKRAKPMTENQKQVFCEALRAKHGDDIEIRVRTY